MGIANQQILSHLSIDDIPKSMLTNGGGSIHENEIHNQNLQLQSNGKNDQCSSPLTEVNEKNGKL